MILIRLNASRPDDLRPAFQLTLDECVKLLRWQTSNIPILIAPFTVAADAISRNRRSDENNELRKQLGGRLGGVQNRQANWEVSPTVSIFCLHQMRCSNGSRSEV